MTTASTFPTQNIDPRYAAQSMATIQAAARAQAHAKAAVASAAANGESTASGETTETSSTGTTTLAQTAASASKLSGGEMDKLLGQFQSIMFTEMMKAMRSTVPKSELFKKSSGEETFESFLDEQYANAASQGVGGLGLTKALKRQLGLSDDDSKMPSPESIFKKNQAAAIQAARSQPAILAEKE
jgi:Rod binding domain-containing protein